jgi:hypothetical protein
MEAWARQTGSCFSAEKTDLIHLTRKKGEHMQAQVSVNGTAILLSPTTKLLRVTVFD